MAILTTGVLYKNPNTVEAHIEVVNLDTNESRLVTVQVFNWGNAASQTGAVAIFQSTVTLPPNTTQMFNAPIPRGTVHYEVRVTVPNVEDVVINVFGRNFNGVPQEGNTVLHRELNQVNVD